MELTYSRRVIRKKKAAMAYGKRIYKGVDRESETITIAEDWTRT